MSEELAIEILKQATIETTTGACEKCPIKDKNKTCIGCLDEAKEIVLNQLQQKENIIKEVREYKNQLLFDLNRQYITFEKWEEILNPIDEILDKGE